MGHLFNKKTLFIILAILIAALFIVKNLMRNSVPHAFGKSTETWQGQTVAAAEPQDQLSGASKKYVIQALTNSGWTSSAAESVYELNQPLFDQAYDALGKEELEKCFLAKLRRLGQPEYQQTLTDCPEIASLLGSVLDVDPDGARNIIQTLPVDEEGKKYIYGFYQMHADPEDAARFAQLFQDVQIRDKFIELLKHSPNAFSFLSFLPRLEQLRKANPDAADAYQNWLFGLFDEIIQTETGSPQEEQIAIQLQLFAEIVKNMLLNDSEFYRFLPDCWSNFRTAANRFVAESACPEDAEVYWMYLNTDPLVLQFFYVYRDQNPIELYVQYGPTITAILMSDEYVKPANRGARNRLVRLAFEANENTRQNIVNSGLDETSGFVQLLNRNLSDRIYYCMFDALAQANSLSSGQSTAGRIGYWNSLSDKVLESEFDQTDPGAKAWIPGYDIARLSSRAWNGQEVSWGDVGFATVDAAFLVFDVATLGAGTVVTKTVGTGLKAGAKAGVKATAKNMAKNMAKNLTKEEAKKSVFGSLRVIKNANHYFAEQFKKLPSMNVDISKFVKYAFSNSKVGLKTYKKITGLDARIFMRSDRRVLLDISKVPQTKGGTLVKRLLADTAMAGGFVMALNTEPGQALASQTVKTAKESVRAMSQKAEEVDKAWKQNLSLWWFANQKQ